MEGAGGGRRKAAGGLRWKGVVLGGERWKGVVGRLEGTGQGRACMPGRDTGSSVTCPPLTATICYRDGEVEQWRGVRAKQ